MALLGSLTCRERKVQGPWVHTMGSPAQHREQPPLNLSHLPPAQHPALSQFHNLFAPLFPSSHGVIMVLLLGGFTEAAKCVKYPTSSNL